MPGAGPSETNLRPSRSLKNRSEPRYGRGRLAAPIAAALLAAALLADGCASASAPGTTPGVAVDSVRRARVVQWVRSSAEHRAIFAQTYRFAKRQLRELSLDDEPGTWAVIMDADETVLDNSGYEQGLVRAHQQYSDASWARWVREEAETALPGAADFVRFAHELGGRVVIVTNRAQSLCDATRDTFRRLSIAVDLVLCQSPGLPNKEPRFRAVQDGTTGSGLPKLRVLMYVGDNILDFPGMSQALRTAPDSAFAEFGRKFIIMPNPIYGSWDGGR